MRTSVLRKSRSEATHPVGSFEATQSRVRSGKVIYKTIYRVGAEVSKASLPKKFTSKLPRVRIPVTEKVFLTKNKRGQIE